MPRRCRDAEEDRGRRDGLRRPDPDGRTGPRGQRGARGGREARCAGVAAAGPPAHLRARCRGGLRRVGRQVDLHRDRAAVRAGRGHDQRLDTGGPCDPPARPEPPRGSRPGHRPLVRPGDARRGAQHRPDWHQPPGRAAGPAGGVGNRPAGDGPRADDPRAGRARAGGAAPGRRRAGRRQPRRRGRGLRRPRDAGRAGVRAGDRGDGQAVEQLPHGPDLRLRQRARPDRRVARPRPAGGHPGGEPRLPAPGPGQARVRRRGVPVEGPVHHDR